MTATSIVSPTPAPNAIPSPGSQSSQSAAQTVAGSAGKENKGHGEFAAVMAKQQSQEAVQKKNSGSSGGPDARPAQQKSSKQPPAAVSLPTEATEVTSPVSGKNMPQAGLSQQDLHQSKAQQGSRKKTDTPGQMQVGLVSSLLSGMAMAFPVPMSAERGPMNPESELAPSAEPAARSKEDMVTDGTVDKQVPQSKLLLHLQSDAKLQNDGKSSAAFASVAKQDGLASGNKGLLLQKMLHGLVSTTPTKQPVVPATVNNLVFDAHNGSPQNAAESVSNLTGNSTATLLAGMLPTQVTASSPGQVLAAPVGANPQWGQALGQQIQVLLGQDIQQAKLQLNPPHLGPLEVHLDIQANGQANATFFSPHPEVLQAITNAIPQLQQSFAAAGMSLGQANVGADSGGRSFSKNKSSSTTSVKTLTEAGDSPSALTMLRVQLGLVNAFA
ncbi:hypothetical protein B1757_05600 [Acidithiobacillus marinus]|uniref:Flagellar hook-length control protein-like C-terminal domain-containing protein n=1 Tax=Acidithiobacillus marinus TaxID=187490 RepID=A0A2I1DN19_9PROT|nr:flagellar hook-length control protein FliK [Acidithiobacillus marinus]PKY11262.1 hypothetical protein B1757_05600 [Acidithiobacillus marinus]